MEQQTEQMNIDAPKDRPQSAQIDAQMSEKVKHMDPNWIRLDRVIGEKNLRRIDLEIKKCVDIVIENGVFSVDDKYSEEERCIEARKYILAELLETFGTWKKTGDCIPNIVKMGKFGNTFLKIEVITEEEVKK